MRRDPAMAGAIAIRVPLGAKERDTLTAAASLAATTVCDFILAAALAVARDTIRAANPRAAHIPHAPHAPTGRAPAGNSEGTLQ